MRSLIIATLLLASIYPSKADESLVVAIDLAEQAIAKGYGSMCNLEMKPVTTGGYYPCFDFGPYRYVRGYGKVAGYVIQKGKQPFPIFSGSKTSPTFTFKGPWETDVVSRMVMWWNDNIEDGSRKAKQEAKANENQSAAAEYINSLNKSSDDEPPKDAQIKNTAPPAKTEILTDDIRTILGQ
jgi:hypothetical protein